MGSPRRDPLSSHLTVVSSHSARGHSIEATGSWRSVWSFCMSLFTHLILPPTFHKVPTARYPALPGHTHHHLKSDAERLIPSSVLTARGNNLESTLVVRISSPPWCPLREVQRGGTQSNPRHTCAPFAYIQPATAHHLIYFSILPKVDRPRSTLSILKPRLHRAPPCAGQIYFVLPYFAPRGSGAIPGLEEPAYTT